MKKIYIVGIEGAGTSALARLYKARGYQVSGSDEGDGFYRSALAAHDITVHDRFDPSHIVGNEDFVVHSTAYDEKNIEIAQARKRNIAVLSYPEALGQITGEYYSIAVCGTHGKTTTTGMLAHTLLGGGRDVSALIGAPVIGWDGGSRFGKGEEFVFEADEYQNKLQHYHPQAVILTSIDFDHPDFFVDFTQYKEAFTGFVQRLPRIGILVVAYDAWQILAEEGIALQCTVLTYGENVDADIQLLDRSYDTSGMQEIDLLHKAKEAIHTITTHLPGKHNAYNAIAAWTMSTAITGDPEKGAQGLAVYQGVARRFERHASVNGAVMIDDYAHHPEEIRTTLATVREVYPEHKVIAAFHPHSHSRTAALLEEFARALDMADEVIVLDIYAIARENKEDYAPVSAQSLVDAVNQGVSKKAHHIPDVDALRAYIAKNLTKDHVLITLGAGDIYHVHDKNV